MAFWVTKACGPVIFPMGWPSMHSKYVLVPTPIGSRAAADTNRARTAFKLVPVSHHSFCIIRARQAYYCCAADMHELSVLYT